MKSLLVLILSVLFPLLATGQSNLVAIADDQPKIIIMDASTCQEVANITNAILSSPIRGLTYINSTTFVAATSSSSSKKVAFFSWSTYALLDSFDTGHNEEIKDLAYLESSTGDKVIVTGSSDNRCKVFKWTGSEWSLRLNFTEHVNDVNVVIALSTGQIATGSKDVTVKVWNYDTGVLFQSVNATYEVKGLAQISSDLLAIGRNNDNLLIWCFTNNTIIKTINVNGHTRVIKTLTSTKFLAGTNSHYTIVVDWTTGVTSSYKKDEHDVNWLAITSSTLVVSVSDGGSKYVTVRDVSNLNISAGNNVCAKNFSNNLKSMVAQNADQLGFDISDAGNIVAISNEQSKITIFDASSCQEKATITDSVLSNPIRGLTYINSTTFAAASTTRKIAFFSWTSYSLLDSFDTGHNEEIKDLAYLESTTGDKVIVTACADDKSRVFKWSGTAWTLSLIFTSHYEDINVVIALPSGQIATGSYDDRVKIWDYETGTVMRNYLASFDVFALAQIASNLLAVGGNSNNLKIWCFTNNTEIMTLNSFESVRVILALTTTKITVGTTGDKTYIFDWVSGVYSTYYTNNNDIYDSATTSNMLVISISEWSSQIKVRDVTGLNISSGNDVCVKSFTSNPKSILAQSPNQLVFDAISPTTSITDLSDLVILGDELYQVTIFNARTCQELALIAHSNLTSRVRCLTMINSTTFAAAIDKKVVFYTIDTQLMVGYFETGHNEDINDMAYLETTAGDKVIVTGSFDDKCRVFKWSGTAWIYSLNFTSHTEDINAVIALSTGRIATGSYDDRVKVWDYQTGSVSQNYVAGYDVFALAQISSNLLAVGGNSNNMKIWCFTNNTEIKTVNAENNVRAIQVATSTMIVVGTSGGYTYLIDWVAGTNTKYQTNTNIVIDTSVTSTMLVVSVGEDRNSIQVRDITGQNIATGANTCSKTFSYSLRSVVAPSPKKLVFDTTNTATSFNNLTDLVVMGDEGNQVTILNARTCQEVATISHTVLSTSIRGLTQINSTVFAALSNKKVAFFSTDTLTMVSSFDTGHWEEVYDMAYWQSSAGDKYIVTGSADDKCKVFKWSGTTWANQLNFSGHYDNINAVIFLSTGQVVSASSDDSVKVWDSQTGAVAKTFATGNDVRTLAQVSSNLVAVGGHNIIFWIWDYTTNTVVRNITSPDWVRTIQVVSSSVIAVGTTGGHNTLIVDWVSGTLSKYQTNTGDIIDSAVTSGMLVVSIGEGTATIKVRDISGLNISVGNDVCTKTMSRNLWSILSLSPRTTNLDTFTTTTTSTSTTTSTTTTTTTTSSTTTIAGATTTSSTTTTTTTTSSSTSTLTTSTVFQVTSASATAPTIITNVAEILASLPTGPIDFSSLTTTQTVSLLASGLDVGNCLINCSSSGACSVSNGQLVCKCYGDYAGPACDLNLNPCSSSPCLNNGTCLITGNYTAAYESNNQTTMYACECSYGYYGPNCESKVNLCENVTCSGNGKCQDMGSTTKCNCFYLFSGDDCETESKQKAAIQTVMSIASVLAIVLIVMFYVLLALLDLSNLLMWYHQHKTGSRNRGRVVRKVFYTA